MVKVKCSGYSSNEGSRIFEILDRKKVEKIIDELNPREIYKKTFEEASGYYHTGSVYCYLDARTGEIETIWMSSNQFEHPWNSFYKIFLCWLETGNGNNEFQTDDLIDPTSEEYKKWEESGLSPEEFIFQEYGEEELQYRIENAIDWYASEFELDYENIKRQLNELYALEYFVEQEEEF